MRLDDALDQLSAIHEQVLRSETFRGYRAAPTAATGVLACGAAAVQQLLAPATAATGFVWYWVLVAVAAGAVVAVDVALHTLRDGPGAGRRTALALRQMVPALAVGALLTAALAETAVADHLPGIWAACFGLGLVASRPFLPAGIGAVAAFYICAGAALLLPALREPLPSPFGMGLTFGVGQLAAAFVLHRAEEERLGR